MTVAMGIDPQETRTSLKVVAPPGHTAVLMRFSPPLDDAELSRFCSDNPDVRVEQNAQGELIVTSPTGAETGRINNALNALLYAWATEAATGVCFDSSTGFRLPNGATRAPDAAWVRNDRWEALTDEQKKTFAPLCPDFVVELRSPTDALGDLQDKLEEYIDCGAQLGWLIDPQERKVHVYRPDADVQVLDDPAAVSGDPELPRFELALGEIW